MHRFECSSFPLDCQEAPKIFVFVVFFVFFVFAAVRLQWMSESGCGRPPTLFEKVWKWRLRSHRRIIRRTLQMSEMQRKMQSKTLDSGIILRVLQHDVQNEKVWTCTQAWSDQQTLDRQSSKVRGAQGPVCKQVAPQHGLSNGHRDLHGRFELPKARIRGVSRNDHCKASSSRLCNEQCGSWKQSQEIPWHQSELQAWYLFHGSMLKEGLQRLSHSQVWRSHDQEGQVPNRMVALW